MAKGKFTRKQLRQPDEFITFSNRAWLWLVVNATRVIVMAAVTVVLVVAAGVWMYFHHQKQEERTAALSHGLDIYSQLLFAGAEKGEVREAESPGGVPHFTTARDKASAAESAFTAVADKDSTCEIGELALLMRANARFDLGKIDEAIADFVRYFDRVRDAESPFRMGALEGLVYAYEAKRDWGKALDTALKLPQEGEDRFVGLLHQARILAAKGDRKEAKQRYQQIIDKAESQELIDIAGQRLASLDPPVR